MFKIDHSTAASTEPTRSSLGTVGFFTDGNPATGTAATTVTAEFLNAVMKEISYAVTSAGLTLSKADDTQLWQAIQAAVASGQGLPAKFIQGCETVYASASSIQIRPGLAISSDGTASLTVSSAITVDFANANGANGLDTGSEASSTWYYVWLIKNPTTGTVAGLLSASRTSPTLPSGYTKKVMLPIAWRNDSSSNLVPIEIASGWPQAPVVYYSNYETFNSNYRLVINGTATTFTAISSTTCQALLPPIARGALLYSGQGNSNAADGRTYIRPGGSSLSTGMLVGESDGASALYWMVPYAPVSSTQGMEYRVVDGSSYIDVMGFYVNGLNL